MIRYPLCSWHRKEDLKYLRAANEIVSRSQNRKIKLLWEYQNPTGPKFGCWDERSLHLTVYPRKLHSSSRITWYFQFKGTTKVNSALPFPLSQIFSSCTSYKTRTGPSCKGRLEENQGGTRWCHHCTRAHHTLLWPLDSSRGKTATRCANRKKTSLNQLKHLQNSLGRFLKNPFSFPGNFKCQKWTFWAP